MKRSKACLLRVYKAMDVNGRAYKGRRIVWKIVWSVEALFLEEETTFLRENWAVAFLRGFFTQVKKPIKPRK